MANASNGGALLLGSDYAWTGDHSFSGTVTVTGSLVDTGTALASPVITGTVTGGATYTAPVLTTPTLGVATATSLNGNTFTTGTYTLTGAASKILTFSNTLTLAGTDSTTMTFPSTSATIARTDAANTFTGVQTMVAPAISGAGTITGVTETGVVYGDTKVLASGITYTSNVTPAVITGFSWTVVAGTYQWEINLPITMTTNGGLALSFVLTTAVLTSIQYQTYAATADDGGTGVSTNGTTTTSATKIFDSKTAAYTHISAKGTTVVGTGGTFAFYGCQNTSAGGGDVTTLALGSYARMTRVA